MPEITITLKITVPDGATVEVSTDTQTAQAQSEAGGPDPAAAWMEEHAPAPQQRLQRQLLERLREKFGLVGTPPATGSRPYLNFYPGAPFGSSRVAALTLTTGRFYATLDPALVAEFPGTEAAEGKYLTVYLRQDSNIDLAVALVERALRQRGWEPDR